MPKFEIMGYAMPEGSDVNTSFAGTASKPPLVPIYATDSEEEVDRILRNGGYVVGDTYYVAEGYRLSEEPRTIDHRLRIEDTPRKSALNPPDTSTAEILPDGTVRTDRNKRPETMEDVAKELEYEMNLPPKKRQILP